MGGGGGGGDYVMVINDKLCKNGEETTVASLKAQSLRNIKVTYVHFSGESRRSDKKHYLVNNQLDAQFL
jgi:hypothetical protein